MSGYAENPNVQNSGSYITIIPVEYTRRGYPMQAEYQYKSVFEYVVKTSPPLLQCLMKSQFLPLPACCHLQVITSSLAISEFRSREEYYSVQSQKLQAEVNAHLYSVSQRLPHLTYSPLGRHAEWEKHDPHKALQTDSKESNSSDSLEKSVMGSNLSSCSNQTSSSIAAGSFSTTEPITSGGSSTSAISPPLPGSSSTSSSSATTNPVVGVYLMSKTVIMVEMSTDENPMNVTAARLLNAVLATEELGLVQPSIRSLATNVFALWMCSPLLEIQLKPHHYPWRVWASWHKLVYRYGHGSDNKMAKDQPVLRLQRNVFFPKQLEENIKDSRIQELLYEEARFNVVSGRYPLESAQAVMLGGLQARIQLGPYDPHTHTAKFFRENQDKYLPHHARSGRWANLLPAGRKGSPEAKLLEQAQRPAAAPPRKLRHKYLTHVRTLPTYGIGGLPASRKGSPEVKLLERAQRPAAAPPRKLRHKYLTHVRTLPTYGPPFNSTEAKLVEHALRLAAAPPRKLHLMYLTHVRTLPTYEAAFFQGQIEQPVRSLASLLTHEDIPVLVAINSTGVYVIDDTESTVLLGLLYEELSWDLGLPSEHDEDCLPSLFLQFMVVENGLRVSKILQVFSNQALMMDTLIEHFAGEYRKRLGQDTPSEHANYEYHSDSGSISLPPLSRPDSPQRRLANKLSRLALATHDGRGNLLGGAGDWNATMNPSQPSWLLPRH